MYLQFSHYIIHMVYKYQDISLILYLISFLIKEVNMILHMIIPCNIPFKNSTRSMSY